MLKKFALKNYRNFKDEICIDFSDVGGYQFSKECITDGMVGKMLIYGRNATGKTNFGFGLMDITETLFGYGRSRKSLFLNADSDELYAAFSYTFVFDGKDVVYEYTRREDYRLYDEKLLVNGKSVFCINVSNNTRNYVDSEYLNIDDIALDNYIDTIGGLDNIDENADKDLSFLRWIINNTAQKSDSILLRLSDYVRRMKMITVSGLNLYYPLRLWSNFYKSLEDEAELQRFERFLNAMGIKCKLVLKKLPDGTYELYTKHKKLIPFYITASSGTLSLVSLYQSIVNISRKPSLLYLDEFDAFYHYELSEKVIEFLKLEFPECQIIFTSHNTNLMSNRIMRPDCLFILSSFGSLTSLNNATLRELREGHNLEKMYISGEFDKYE